MQFSVKIFLAAALMFIVFCANSQVQSAAGSLLNKTIDSLIKTSLPKPIDSLIKPIASSPTNEKNRMGKWIHAGIQPFITHSHDTTDARAVYNLRVAQYYTPLQGKTIGTIDFKQYGFERSFSDTMSRIKYFGTNLLNHLHTRSKSWVIRNNMFVKPDTKLNANIVADNERYLRSLNFIRDAKILTNVISPASDSVNLTVVTQDLFSLTGSVHSFDLNQQYVNVQDVNFLGLGQMVSGSVLHDINRNPQVGLDLTYSKYNLFNSFTNWTLEYSDIGNNIYSQRQEQHSITTSLNRPLYSQYARYYWNLNIGNVWSEQDYKKIEGDTAFYKYRYKLFDATFGYNLSANKGRNNLKIPFREVISFRYYNYNFLKTPEQFQHREYLEALNPRQAALVQFTVFKQNFFKTNYVLGFGATEDIPYGFNASATGGWYKLKDLSRPYLGVDANEYLHTKQGDIIQFFLRTGGYFNQGLQDATVLAGASMYGRLINWNNLKIRQFMRLSYTQQFDSLAQEPLRINNAFGIEGFSNDSIQGTQRATLRSQTIFYCRGKILGFAMAPYLTGDLSYIRQTKASRAVYNSNVFYSLGGGLRLRNENLVFGTIQLQGLYFPRIVPGYNRFKIDISTNIRFRYNSNYVTPPSLLEYNSDNNGNIF